MRTLIVTPLFPPDASASAKYTKELAARLSALNEVTVLHFGKLPEQLNGVSFISIPKKLTLLPRVWIMLRALVTQSRKVDVVLLQNGPSVELPALLASFLIKKKIVCVVSDNAANKRTSNNRLQKLVYYALQKRTLGEISIANVLDLITPVKHPLQETDSTSNEGHENTWKKHLKEIQLISNL